MRTATEPPKFAQGTPETSALAKRRGWFLDQRLAQQFRTDGDEEVLDEDLELAESVADASDRVNSLRNKIDGVDELLARLNLSSD